MVVDDDTADADFKPFFDMIVGVLFILLILISAQMFFAQQSTLESATNNEAKAKIELMKQIKSFLEQTVDRLRSKGVAADLDLSRRQIRLPLGQFSTQATGGIPSFAPQLLDALGQVMFSQIGCIALPQSPPSDCSETRLLKLGTVNVSLHAGPVPPDSALSPERYAELSTTVFASALLSKQPNLLGFTGTTGTTLLRFNSTAVTGASRPAGDVQFGFAFD